MWTSTVSVASHFSLERSVLAFAHERFLLLLRHRHHQRQRERHRQPGQQAPLVHQGDWTLPIRPARLPRRQQLPLLLLGVVALRRRLHAGQRRPHGILRYVLPRGPSQRLDVLGQWSMGQRRRPDGNVQRGATTALVQATTRPPITSTAAASTLSLSTRAFAAAAAISATSSAALAEPSAAFAPNAATLLATSDDLQQRLRLRQ